MPQYAYTLVNVFTDSAALSGNPLCVFEDARGLDTVTMQALARQFNLSETTFVLPSQHANARVRIFTPTFEMPFAGHPTLGTAAVISRLQSSLQEMTLEMGAGLIPVRCRGNDCWQLSANRARMRPLSMEAATLASLLGLNAGDLAGDAQYVDTGREQLLVPLTSRAAVDRCRASAVRLEALGHPHEPAMVYVFHDEGARVWARFFFAGNGVVLEDPATGSACANLGGWLSARGAISQQRTILQGSHVGRPSKLYLDIDATGAVFVSGDVLELARGVLTLPIA